MAAILIWTWNKHSVLQKYEWGIDDTSNLAGLFELQTLTVDGSTIYM